MHIDIFRIYSVWFQYIADVLTQRDVTQICVIKTTTPIFSEILQMRTAYLEYNVASRTSQHLNLRHINISDVIIKCMDVTKWRHQRKVESASHVTSQIVWVFDFYAILSLTGVQTTKTPWHHYVKQTFLYKYVHFVTDKDYNRNFPI